MTIDRSTLRHLLAALHMQPLIARTFDLKKDGEELIYRLPDGLMTMAYALADQQLGVGHEETPSVAGPEPELSSEERERCRMLMTIGVHWVDGREYDALQLTKDYRAKFGRVGTDGSPAPTQMVDLRGAPW